MRLFLIFMAMLILATSADAARKKKKRVKVALPQKIERQAGPRLSGCYEVAYSKNYLKKVTAQVTTNLQLEMNIGSKPDTKPDAHGMLSLKLRDIDSWKTLPFSCGNNGDSLACSLECDGGVFRLTQGPKGVTMIPHSSLWFVGENCEGEALGVAREDVPGGHVLARRGSGACAK